MIWIIRILLSFGISTLPTYGASSFSLAHRTGQEHCWVSFRVNSEKTLCLTHFAWQQWLNTPSPGPICENPNGPWKSYSRLENSTLHHLSKKFQKIQTLHDLNFRSDSS